MGGCDGVGGVGGVGGVADTNYLYPARWGWINNNKNNVTVMETYI